MNSPFLVYLEIQSKTDSAAARAHCQGRSPFCIIIIRNIHEHLPSAAVDWDSSAKTSETDSCKKSAALRLTI